MPSVEDDYERPSARLARAVDDGQATMDTDTIERARALQEEINRLGAGIPKPSPTEAVQAMQQFVGAHSPSLLIGLGGAFAAGKDTVADFLVEDHGWQKQGMSDALADALYILNPILAHTSTERGIMTWEQPLRYQEVIDGDTKRLSSDQREYLAQFQGYTNVKKLPEVRRLLQVLGTEIGRQMIGEDTWVDIMGRRADDLRKQGINVAWTGMRYPNELTAVRLRGGVLVYVVRPLEKEEGELTKHTSENSVGPEDFDIVIENDGTLEQLREQVTKLHNELSTIKPRPQDAQIFFPPYDR